MKKSCICILAAYPNFHKLEQNNAIPGLSRKYDTRSIMHYSGYAFAIDRRKPTMLRVDNGIYLGLSLCNYFSVFIVWLLSCFYDD